jgi:16S rRNA (uracil1498-N3)-methyltransferase
MTHLQRLSIAASQWEKDRILLTPDQQHYLGRVLRLRAGDCFIALDGRSGWWLAELETGLTEARCLKPMKVHNELTVAITLLMAMPKTGMDDVVRQVTELGVATIVPVQSDRTLLHPSTQKIERWRRIAQEATEQSERQVIPTILEPCSWSAAIATLNSSGDRTTMLRLIALARDSSTPLLQRLQRLSVPRPTQVAIAIGPEGGWTPTEAERAIAAGFETITLGSRILRAITAPAAALAIIAAVFEDPPPDSSIPHQRR